MVLIFFPICGPIIALTWIPAALIVNVLLGGTLAIPADELFWIFAWLF